jgi:hypothetical protein
MLIHILFHSIVQMRMMLIGMNRSYTLYYTPSYINVVGQKSHSTCVILIYSTHQIHSKGGEYMTPVEIMALIFAIAILLKMVMVAINVKGFVKATEPMLQHTTGLTFAYVLLAGIVGYYLLDKFSVVDIAAVTLFVTLLLCISWLPYSKTLLQLRRDLVGKGAADIWKKNWLAVVLWVGLALWVLKDLFM